MKLPKLTLLLTTLIGMTAASGQVTFNEHIAPLIFNNCTVCHREGEIGPMPLTNYAEVSAFANAIDIVVHEGTMPPWPPDRSFSR
ncbi:MAG: redoxin, partial [Verrucomicrobiaceae bacterium]|nr:redoxin [Verrucomicrobiaceae bacterium]